MGKIKKILKIIGLGYLAVGAAVVFLSLGLPALMKLLPTYTDFEGTVWQRYRGNNATPTFAVFAEQSGLDKYGKAAAFVKVEANCAPETMGTSFLEGDYSKGIERPNHCVVRSLGAGGSYTGSSVDLYLLLPDGSIISLSGFSKVQVNINKDGVYIVQAQGKAYYRIKKQPEGQSFVIQVGSQTFTATGTEVAVNVDSKEAKERTAQVAVVKGSLKITAGKKKVPAADLKAGQKVSYKYLETKPTSCEKGNKLCGDKCIPETLTCCEQSRFSKVAPGAYCVNPEAKSCLTALQPGINILRTPKQLRCCPAGKTACTEEESLGEATTVTPVKMAKTDALMTDDFTKKQAAFAGDHKFVWEDASAAQAKQQLQKIIANLKKSNQQKLDEMEQQSEKNWNAWIESLKGEADTYWDNTANNTNNQICPEGYYLATDMLCYPESYFYTCKPGYYLGTDKMCHKKSSGSGPSSGTSEQCGPPGSAIYQTFCEFTNQGYIKNGQCCVSF